MDPVPDPGPSVTPDPGPSVTPDPGPSGEPDTCPLGYFECPGTQTCCKFLHSCKFVPYNFNKLVTRLLAGRTGTTCQLIDGVEGCCPIGQICDTLGPCDEGLIDCTTYCCFPGNKCGENGTCIGPEPEPGPSGDPDPGPKAIGPPDKLPTTTEPTYERPTTTSRKTITTTATAEAKGGRVLMSMTAMITAVAGLAIFL